MKFAGQVTRLELEEGESMVSMKALGTDSEGILKAHSAQPLQLFKGHICRPGCGKLTSGDYMIHCIKGRRLNRDQEEEWTNNLVGHRPPAEEADEMADLRERADHLRRRASGGEPPQRGQGEVPLPREGEETKSPVTKSKKKDKKGEETVKGGLRGEAPRCSSSESAEGPLFRNGVGPQGEGASQGSGEGAEVRLPQKAQVNQRIFGELQFLNQPDGGGIQRLCCG